MADVYKQSFKQNYTNNIELSILNWMYLMALSTYWLEEEAVCGLPALVSFIREAMKR